MGEWHKLLLSANTRSGAVIADDLASDSTPGTFLKQTNTGLQWASTAISGEVALSRTAVFSSNATEIDIQVAAQRASLGSWNTGIESTSVTTNSSQITLSAGESSIVVGAYIRSVSPANVLVNRTYVVSKIQESGYTIITLNVPPKSSPAGAVTFECFNMHRSLETDALFEKHTTGTQEDHGLINGKPIIITGFGDGNTSEDVSSYNSSTARILDKINDDYFVVRSVASDIDEVTDQSNNVEFIEAATNTNGGKAVSSIIAKGGSEFLTQLSYLNFRAGTADNALTGIGVNLVQDTLPSGGAINTGGSKIELKLPQDIGTGSNVDFGSLRVAKNSKIELDKASSDTAFIQSPTGTANDLTISAPKDDATINLTATTVAVSNDLTVEGDLTINGATTTISTTNTVVSDKLIELSTGTTGTPSGDSGIIIERGDSNNAAFIWDESEDRFKLGETVATGASSSDISVTLGTLNANIVGELTGNASSVTDGIYTTDTGTVTNTILANDSITIGNTVAALSSTPYTTITGLTSVTSTDFIGALTGNVVGDIKSSSSIKSGVANTQAHGIYLNYQHQNTGFTAEDRYGRLSLTCRQGPMLVDGDYDYLFDGLGHDAPKIFANGANENNNDHTTGVTNTAMRGILHINLQENEGQDDGSWTNVENATTAIVFNSAADDVGMFGLGRAGNNMQIVSMTDEDTNYNNTTNGKLDLISSGGVRMGMNQNYAERPYSNTDRKGQYFGMEKSSICQKLTITKPSSGSSSNGTSLVLVGATNSNKRFTLYAGSYNYQVLTEDWTLKIPPNKGTVGDIMQISNIAGNVSSVSWVAMPENTDTNWSAIGPTDGNMDTGTSTTDNKWSIRDVKYMIDEHGASGGGDIDISGTPVANDFARWTDGDTLEGRSYAEVKADLDLEIGTDVLAQQTIGIADDNLVEVDAADVADNDFAKFTANGLEGRSPSEVLSDIGAQASGNYITGAGSLSSQDLTDIGNLSGTNTGDGTYGISNTNYVKIDSASVADDEYARFTASGLESRSASEVLSDIGAQASGSYITSTLTAALNAGANQIGFTENGVSNAVSMTVNWGIGNKASVILSQAGHTIVMTNPATACNLLLKITQGSSGSDTITTWTPSAGNIYWAGGGTAPTLSTSASAIDIISFYFDGTDYYGAASLDFS